MIAVPRILSCLLFLSLSVSALAADAIPPIERRLPPRGMEIPAAQRARWSARLEALQQRAQRVNHALRADADIYLKAVEFALLHNELYREKEFSRVDNALDIAAARLTELQGGEASWRKQRGAIARGYFSSVDGSPQPYGLQVPERLDLSRPVPLYVWLHGRGDKVTDLHFLHQRSSGGGPIAPPDAIVLHPFGRQCIGYKSAGEVDVLEAIAHVQSQYQIDEDRVVLMGFSMGGAGCWHLGAHYTDRFVAMSPGAGFAETARYINLSKDQYPPWYEQRLWTLYDVPNYTRNLFQIPVVAYSGEMDKQIQAARVMEEAFLSQGRNLNHVIGPGMGHKYHPDSLAAIMREMAAAVQAGRDRHPAEISLQTRTLRYPHMHWLELVELKQHWEDTRIDARFGDEGTLDLRTRNVAAFRFRWRPKQWNGKLRIDGHPLEIARESAGEVPAFELANGGWKTGGPDEALAKRPGMQGPIDDAFLSSFLVVLPSNRSEHERVQAWLDFELEHFASRWQALFRGTLRMKKDQDVTSRDLRDHNLVLWGTPESNSVLASVMADMPWGWNPRSLTVDGQPYDARHHVPVMIYPKRFHWRGEEFDGRQVPGKYVVINSGPTFREAHDRTNSLQNPKLPDWAVLDIRQDPSAESAGRVAAAGFFDERWRFVESRQGAGTSP